MAAKDSLGNQFSENRPNVPIQWTHSDDTSAYGNAPHKFDDWGDIDPLLVEVEHDPNAPKRPWMANVEGIPIRYANSDIAMPESQGYGTYSTKQRALWAAQAMVNRHHTNDMGPRPYSPYGYFQPDVLDRIAKSKKRRAANKD